MCAIAIWPAVRTSAAAQGKKAVFLLFQAMLIGDYNRTLNECRTISYDLYPEFWKLLF